MADRVPPLRLALHPTSSSWLNLVERWFAELTTQKLRRGGTRPRTRTQGPDADLERRPQALHLDEDRRPDPRIHHYLLPRIRITTLVHLGAADRDLRGAQTMAERLAKRRDLLAL